jgi:hypothetical protein
VGLDTLYSTAYYNSENVFVTKFICPVCADSVGPVNVQVSKTIMCSGDSAELCAPAGFTSYLWNTGDTGICIYAKSTGNYYVIVHSINRCSSASGQVSINVYPSPSVSTAVNGDTLSVYNSVKQQWFLDGNLLPGDTGKMYIASSPGNYSVQVTDSNGCLSMSNEIVISNIGDIPEPNKIAIYPNPLSYGSWFLDVSSDLINSWFSIYDDEGRQVYRSEIQTLNSKIKPNLDAGIYLLCISSNTGYIVRKLVKL